MKWWSVGVLVLVACPGVRDPTNEHLNIAGTVYLGGAERRGDPLKGALVTLTDTSSGAQLAHTTSDASGNYHLVADVPAHTRVVVAFKGDGLAPAFRAMTAGPFTEVTLSASLEPLEPLDCAEGQCLTAGEGVIVDGVADTLVGQARAFEPATELPMMTGLEGLRALVVTYVALDAGTFDGGEADAGYVEDGGFEQGDAGPPRPAGMRTRLPFSAWRRLLDLHPGTGQVEVPSLWFDEASATWQDGGEATLQTESGQTVPESALSALQQGTFAGGAVAVTALSATGYQAIALPAASRGCIQGLATVEGAIKPGVLVSVPGSEPVASDKDGAFCVASPVGAGGAGTAASLSFAGLSYLGPTVPLPTSAGSCGGGCVEAGNVTIHSKDLISAHSCRFGGTVVDAAGAPLGGAVVLAFDDSLSGNVFNSLCGKQSSRCALSASADESGHFELNVPLLDTMTLTSTALLAPAAELVEGTRAGTLRLQGCPTQSVQLRAGSGRDRFEVAVTVTGTQVSWVPAKAAAQLLVVDVTGAAKLELTPPEGVSSPYPTALAAGDTVTVVLDGTGPDGYQYSGSGTAAVP